MLPVPLVLAALLWQAVVAGQALWLSAAAARAAARAARRPPTASAGLAAPAATVREAE